MVGNLANSLAPLIVTAAMDELNIAEVDAGFLVSVEFVGIALTAILIGPLIDRLPKRKMATLGCLLAALDIKGRWASMASTSYLGALAASPVVGGVVMDTWNVQMVGIVTLILEVISLGCMIYVINGFTVEKDSAPVLESGS